VVAEMDVVRGELEQTPTAKRPGKSGQRQKHRPQRTCVACGVKDGKRELIRIVRSPDGVVSIDPTGRADGRGAYICAQTSCWEKALKQNSLSRALKVSIDEPTRILFGDFAASLPDTPPDKSKE
jgi:uncharacterized protein